MGLYRIPTQEDRYIESICENCLNTYYNTGDEILAEDNFFYALNEMNKEDIINSMKSKHADKPTDRYRLSNHQMQQLEGFKSTSQRKITSALQSKDKGTLTKAKEWLEKKLTWLREWAEDCEDNKSKNIIQRMIAFVIRLIDKIARSIKYTVNSVLHGPAVASLSNWRLKYGYKGKSGKFYNHWSNVPEYDKKDEDKGKNKPLFMTD